MNKQRTVIYTKRRHALMGERIGMDLANMIWERCERIIEHNDYEGIRMELFRVMALECPFSEQDYNNKKTPELVEQTFEAAMAGFKGKMDRLAQVANPVIKQVYERDGGRNDPCPCGSGKKFKNCHGKGL